jgi:hypothetical protein
MNMAVRRVAPAPYCTRTQHIELRLATVDDTPGIVRMIDDWFPMTIWKDCLTFDPAKAGMWIERGIRTGCEPFVLAVEAPGKFPAADLDRNGVQEIGAQNQNNFAPVGMISWHLDARLTTRPIAVLDEVFVIPRLRRSDLGRRLILQAMLISEAEGAAVMNFPVASGMPEQQSLINMLVKHIGAEPVGAILRKVL